jgi:hypothetical protein
VELPATLLKAETSKIDFPRSARIYLPSVAPFDMIVTEFEVEDLAEYEAVMAKWREVATPEFWQQWYRLTEPGGANELWTLME